MSFSTEILWLKNTEVKLRDYNLNQAAQIDLTLNFTGMRSKLVFDWLKETFERLNNFEDAELDHKFEEVKKDLQDYLKKKVELLKSSPPPDRIILDVEDILFAAKEMCAYFPSQAPRLNRDVSVVAGSLSSDSKMEPLKEAFKNLQKCFSSSSFSTDEAKRQLEKIEGIKQKIARHSLDDSR